MHKTMGSVIAQLRRHNGMTQLELAEKMGVTDKAVSKWERDLSCPDISTLPRLASILGVSVEELMLIQKDTDTSENKLSEIMQILPKAVAMAMGIAVTVLTILDSLEERSAMVMLGIGLACVAFSLLTEKSRK